MPVIRLGDRPLEAELLVLDKDGVLLDFHHLWRAVTEARVTALCNAAGQLELAGRFMILLGLDEAGRVSPNGLLAVAPRPEATIAAATGLHLWAGMPWLAAREAAHAAFATADAAVAFEQQARALPGAIEAVQVFKAMGVKLAVATTDRTDNARRFLALVGLDDAFDAVVGADRVAHSKPNPAMFELACQECGVRPERAVMVGDGEMDLLMAKAAGAAGAIGLRCGIGTPEALAPLADGMFADLLALAQACES